MPFKYSIHPETNLIRQILWGTVTAADLRALAEAQWSDPLYRPKLHVLADIRDAKIDIPYEQMLGYTQFLSGQSNIGRQAIVVSRQLEFGLARMYEQLTESNVLRTDLRVFFSLEEAEQWLGTGDPAGKTPPQS